MTKRAEKTRLEIFQADYTPATVVLQGLSVIKQAPVSVLDPSAGSGVFAKCLHKLWPNCEVLSLEPREEEASALRDCSDFSFIGTFEQWLESLTSPPYHEVPKFDLIATNPPFCCLAPLKGEGWIPTLLSLLKPGGHLLLYALNDLGQRSKAGAKLFDSHGPIGQFRVCGPVSHRPDGKSDARDYSWWLWDDKPKPRSGWTAYNLPRLTGRDRKLGSHVFDINPTVIH